MDINQEIKSFMPIDIEKFSQNNNVTEIILDSVKAYNKAIEYLRTGSEDIAMIELKKVVAVNPDFYEAVNLLGLCYAYTNQLEKAEELFGKVVKGENNVIKAADYLNYVSMSDGISPRKNTRSKSKPIKSAKPAKPSKAVKVPAKKEELKEVQTEYILLHKIFIQLRKPLTAMIVGLVGLLCLAASIVFFYMAFTGTKEVGVNNKPAENTQFMGDYNKTVAENEELRKQLDEANLQIKQVQLSADISQVSELYGQKKYEEAADKLMSISADSLTEEQKKRYDSMKEDVYLKAANQLTNEGNSLYNGKKYKEAVEKLEKVFELGSKWTFGDKALYILGKSAVETGDNQKGAQAYQKLIDEYPKSSYVKYAKSRLNGLV